ncbi:MAG: ABC transporter ATP-binding protein [Clostridiales bacterium]|nr:ABC transporter ATP-binding protein [Clostridiales bacterium]
MSKIVCKGIKKNYKNKAALKGVDLTLESGRIYGLIGRNGAGKTTLLSIISAQNPLSEGSVELDGETIWENQAALDRICFSREINVSGSNGIGTMKIKEYLKTAAIYYPNWDKVMAEKLINEFGIDVKKAMGKVNKGMLSAVTITVALASKAEFTFLDEPVAGLDVIARENFYRILLDEFSATGRTFVISTHIIEEAANVFEDVILVRDGEIIRMEDTQELVERCRYVSGLEAEVDKAVAGLETHHAVTTGRGKSVTVVLKPGEKIAEGYDVTVQPMSLQNVFVALCGDEREN